MVTRGATRRKILELGESLLQQRGFNGFSYHHISSELGIKNAAIHYHFPTKEDLGLQIISRIQRRFLKWANHPEHRIRPVKEQLDWYIKIYQYHLEHGNRVCLIGTMATDYNTLPTSLQTSSKELSRKIHSWMARLLDSGRQRNEIQFVGNSQDKALMIICSLTGSLQLARLLGKEYFYSVVDQIYIDLKLT